jgi:plastocyanin
VLIKSSILPAGVAVVVAAIALALGSSRGGVSVAAPSKVITGDAIGLKIANYAFAPAALTVKVGTRITVTNSDSTAHTATSSSGAFDSGTLKQGQSSHFTLKKAGTYTYICQFHAFMTGTINVVG